MKNRNIIFAIGATVGLIGCASTKDLSQLEANVNTASRGDFGTCMQSAYGGAKQLEKAQKVLREGQEKDGKISQSRFDEGMQASEFAVTQRRTAEQACTVRLAAVEDRAQRTEVRVQRTKEVLRGVTFATGSANLTQGAKATLDVVANRLLRQPTQVFIAGHTSSVGAADFNMTLSQRRADAVRNYLISQGVPADSITATGYGQTQPIASNDTTAGQRANQRVEISYEQEIQ